MFGTIMTCLLTWDKLGTELVRKTVRSVLGDLTYYFCLYKVRFSTQSIFRNHGDLNYTTFKDRRERALGSSRSMKKRQSGAEPRNQNKP